MTISEMQQRWNPEIDFEITYYLSGPMAGYDQHNFPAFEDAARILRQTGLKIISPHETAVPANYDELSEEEQWRVMVDQDIALMKDSCGGIIMLKGWPQSRGAREEIQIAFQRNWPVWYYHDYQLVNMNRGQYGV